MRDQEKQSVHGDETKAIQRNLDKIQRLREKKRNPVNLSLAPLPLNPTFLNCFFSSKPKIHGIIPTSAESFLGEAALPVGRPNKKLRDNPMMLPRNWFNREIGERGSAEGDGVRITGGAAGAGAGA